MAQRCGPTPCDCPDEEQAALASRPVVAKLESDSVDATYADEASAVLPGRPGGLIALQRQAGNAAVAALIQRTLGDGHDLTSDRFAGIPVLEAAFDDEARLSPGAHGEPVVRIQQALADQGFDLGPTGVDGTYGPRTAAAVRAFKTRESLGSTEFGDIGPGTMTRLDELFPGNKGGGGEEPDLTCPSSDDVITAAGETAPGAASADPTVENSAAPQLETGRGAVVGLQERTAGAGGAPGAGVGSTGPGGLDPLDAAVFFFKLAVNVPKAPPGAPAATSNVAASGQFFWKNNLDPLVERKLRVLLLSEPASKAFATRGLALLDRIRKSHPANKAEVAAITVALAALAATAKTSEEKAVVDPGPAKSAGRIEFDLWNGLNKTNAMPDLNSLASLPVLFNIHLFAKVGCGDHVERMMDRLKSRGFTPPTRKQVKGVDASLLAGGKVVRDCRPFPQSFSPRFRGDVLPHRPASGVAAEMKAALDSQVFLEARVVSGVGFGGNECKQADPKATPRPLDKGPGDGEHSLMIFAHDGKSTFVFHDPDATESQDPETGFGKLHLDAATGRLSTATDNDDMAVDAAGHHSDGKTRKRYQLIRVRSLH
jgi:hypothetical protein